MSTPLWYSIEAINIIAEAFIIYIYFSKLLPDKYTSRRPYVGTYGLLCGWLFTSVIMTLNSTVNLIGTLVFIYLISLLLYEGSASKKAFFSILLMFIIIVSEMIFIGSMTVMKLTTPEELSIRGPARISGMVGVKILYFWIIALVCRLINKKIREIPSKHWIIIISMPIVSILVLYTLAISYINLNGQMITTLFLLAIAGLSFINIAFFDFFENYNKQLRLSILEQVVEHENTNYKQLENAYSEMRKLKHDVSNQVTIINDLIARNEKDSASEVIHNLSERLDEINYICYTGEPIIDSIINIKLKSAHDMGIKVSKNIAVNKFSLDCFELCRALGNALDNSIEACQRYENDEKYIHMSMQQIEDKIAIEISNSSDVVDPKNLQTKKKNKAAHNIGMSSIKTSVKKLGGYISYDFKDNIFYLKIVVLNK